MVGWVVLAAAGAAGISAATTSIAASRSIRVCCFMGNRPLSRLDRFRGQVGAYVTGAPVGPRRSEREGRLWCRSTTVAAADYRTIVRLACCAGLGNRTRGYAHPA